MAGMVSLFRGQRDVARARLVLPALLIAVLIIAVMAGCAAAEDGGGADPFPLSDEIMADADGYLILVNTENLLTSTDKPADLVNVSARKTSSTAIQMREPVSLALSALFDAAKEDGLTLYIHSGYRSYQTQRDMFALRMERLGYDDKMVQRAGASDHQTGMGADVINKALIGQRFGESFGGTKEGLWLAERCAEFGFVIRYPKDKVGVTGIEYEPWHLRYVGLEAARYMTDAGVTLEELWEQWEAYQAGEWVGAYSPGAAGSIEPFIVDDGELIIGE
ncbi:MAG: D-alanyl-D-alanine carboxypeptidase family protein [Oscillospiraceae bacterium]|nr:D-alanyl-D-alanine carboxypeptidase family protein [Oscillospiraceae bacterium]